MTRWKVIGAVLVSALLVPTLILAVSDVVTRDTNQTPCPSIDSSSAECRNLRLNNTSKGLLVSIAGVETGASVGTVTQGTAASAGAGWPVYLQPPTAGTGPFLRAATGVNTAVTTTISAVAGQRVYVNGVCAGYAANPLSPLAFTITDGTTTISKTIPGASTVISNICLSMSSPWAFASGASVTATLPANGAAITGELIVWGYQQ